MKYHGENFCGLLIHTDYCPPSLRIFAEKTFADRQKIVGITSFLRRKIPARRYVPEEVVHDL